MKRFRPKLQLHKGELVMFKSFLATVFLVQFFFFISNSIAGPKTDSKPSPNVEWSLEIKHKPPQKNVAEFSVPKDYHFNHEAPNAAETLIEGQWVKAGHI